MLANKYRPEPGGSMPLSWARWTLPCLSGAPSLPRQCCQPGLPWTHLPCPGPALWLQAGGADRSPILNQLQPPTALCGHQVPPARLRAQTRGPHLTFLASEPAVRWPWWPRSTGGADVGQAVWFTPRGVVCQLPQLAGRKDEVTIGSVLGKSWLWALAFSAESDKKQPPSPEQPRESHPLWRAVLRGQGIIQKMGGRGRGGDARNPGEKGREFEAAATRDSRRPAGLAQGSGAAT